YNFMRTKNILGFNKMMEAIKNWKPDYNKGICALKTAFIQMIANQNKRLYFFSIKRLVLFKG
ncbi:MAG: hypothetical protein ABIW34_06160, partial [Ginsengibacter sp.]